MMRSRITAVLRRLRGRPMPATGGTVYQRDQGDDLVPAFLSSGRSTTVRPGETLLEATQRLHDGRDL